MKSNIFSSNSSILVTSSIQVFIKFSRTIMFSQSNTMFTSAISTLWLQVSFKSFNFQHCVISFILKEIQYFIQQFVQYSHQYIFHVDYGERLKELESLHSLIRSLIYESFQFGNTLISWHAHTLIFCMFRVRFKNHHNIFLACPMGPIFVKHNSVDLDAKKIEK